MPLDVATLKSAIESAYLSAGGSLTPESTVAAKAQASAVAAAIHAFILTGTVTTTVAPGQNVVTAGSPSAQTGQTTTPGTGTGTVA